MFSKEKSERRNYTWNLMGSVFSSVTSTFLLLIVTRILNPESVDLFGITYSLGQQLLIIGLFQVRDFQATDVIEKYSFQIYLLSRLTTIFLMIISAIIFIIANQYNFNRSLIFFFLILWRACDAFSDVYQGFFQQKGRSEFSGKVLFFRSILVIFLFGFSIIVSKSLLFASVTSFVINLLLFPFLDFHYYKKLNFSYEGIINKNHGRLVMDLLRTCLPLFVNGFLITYIFNEPKLVIDDLLMNGSVQTGLQRDFNILFMPTFIMSLMLMILRPKITRLADLWLQKSFKQFYKEFKRLTIFLLALGIITTLLGYWVGTELLGFIYGVNLIGYKLEFAILLLGGIFNVLASILGNILTIYRKQSNLVIVYIITFIASKLFTGPLVVQYGMFGASLSFVLVMFIFWLTSLVVYAVINNYLIRIME